MCFCLHFGRYWNHHKSHLTAGKNRSSLGLQGLPWGCHEFPQNGCKAEDAQVTLLATLQRTMLNLLLSYGCKLAGNWKEGALGWFNRHPNLQSYTELFFRIMREPLSRTVQDSSSLPVWFGSGVYFELITSNYIFFGASVHTEECPKEQMVFIIFRWNWKEGFKKESDCALAAAVCLVHRSTLDSIFRSPPSCIWET